MVQPPPSPNLKRETSTATAWVPSLREANNSLKRASFVSVYLVLLLQPTQSPDYILGDTILSLVPLAAHPLSSAV